jgi:CRISPR/Cas system-associated exonuclease Cas4 (RecB family)
MAYNGLLEVSTINGNLARIFDNGSSLEDRIDKYFSKMGILLGREISLKNDLPPISGRMDFLISHEKHGHVPIELKSINTRGFENLKEAKPEHILQLHTYMNLYNKTAEIPVSHGIVLYENKNDQKLKAFIQELDAKIWNDILTRLLKIMDMKTIPEECTGDKWCKCKEV